MHDSMPVRASQSDSVLVGRDEVSGDGLRGLRLAPRGVHTPGLLSDRIASDTPTSGSSSQCSNHAGSAFDHINRVAQAAAIMKQRRSAERRASLAAQGYASSRSAQGNYTLSASKGGGSASGTPSSSSDSLTGMDRDAHSYGGSTGGTSAHPGSGGRAPTAAQRLVANGSGYGNSAPGAPAQFSRPHGGSGGGDADAAAEFGLHTSNRRMRHSYRAAFPADY